MIDPAQHLGLVHIIAGSMNFAPLELDDAIGAGYVGLCEAAKTYDPSRGFKFSAIATVRIRGAILDERRRLTGRSGRLKPRVLDIASQPLAPKIKDSVDVEAEAISRADAAAIRKHIDALPARLRLCVYARTTRGGIVAAAKALGLSESRVSQLSKVGLRKLTEAVV